jgi:hypothetical protein
VIVAWSLVALGVLAGLVALWLFIGARRELRSTTVDLARRLEAMGDVLHGPGGRARRGGTR